MRHTVFRTYVNGIRTYEGPSFNDARSSWVASTYNAGTSVPGGIAVSEYDANGNQTRDAWCVHVDNSGVVYLNSQLTFG
jgi:hypothetical protein